MDNMKRNSIFYGIVAALAALSYILGGAGN